MQTHQQEQLLYDIERKLDMVLKKLNDMDGIKGFGQNLLANAIGNTLFK